MTVGQTLMRRQRWRRGNRLEGFCGDGGIFTSATEATQTDRVQHTQKYHIPYTHTHTHAHSRRSCSDGQFCHQRLPSCHSDTERLEPYECLCSPKRRLGAEVRVIHHSLLMRGHNQMWKLSCTLVGSIVAKRNGRWNIDAVFQWVALRWCEEIGNTLATPDCSGFQVQGFWTRPTLTEQHRMLIIQQHCHHGGQMTGGKKQKPGDGKQNVALVNMSEQSATFTLVLMQGFYYKYFYMCTHWCCWVST